MNFTLLKEVLVTGRTYYEHYFPEAVTEYIEYFNNFEIDGSTKNHILLFGLDLGLFLTITRLLMIYKHPSMVIFCVSLAAFGGFNILLQVRLD